MDTSTSVVGFGYVGLPLAPPAAEKGYMVAGIDHDTSKSKAINNSKCPFTDKQITAQLQKQSARASGKHKATATSKISSVCTPTSVDQDGVLDMAPVISATNHRKFKDITGAHAERMHVKVFADRPNLLDKSGSVAPYVIYLRIGR